MNLDELLASFSRAASEAAPVPLLRVDDYLPASQKQSNDARAGARQLVGGFLYWLAQRGHLSQRGMERMGTDGTTKSLRELLDVLQHRFTDAIEADDLADPIQPFCRAYLPAATGSYADDFHVLFVERTTVKSYLHVSLAPEDLERLAAQVDKRLAAYEQGRPDWQAGLVKGPTPARATAAAHRSKDVEDWRQRLRSFDNAESLSAGPYQSMMAAYLEAMDEALQFPPRLVADELIRTYLWHKDGTVQSSAWRILRTLPPIDVFHGLLTNIESLSSSTEWADELVDLFDEDLDPATLSAMVDELLAQPRGVRLAYTTALHRAQREGSVHAAKLLAALYPNESAP